MKLVYPIRRLLRTDGTVREFDGPLSMTEIHLLIGCETCDSVSFTCAGVK
jgi:hypothetical protein